MSVVVTREDRLAATQATLGHEADWIGEGDPDEKAAYERWLETGEEDDVHWYRPDLDDAAYLVAQHRSAPLNQAIARLAEQEILTEHYKERAAQADRLQRLGDALASAVRNAFSGHLSHNGLCGSFVDGKWKTDEEHCRCVPANRAVRLALLDWDGLDRKGEKP